MDFPLISFFKKINFWQGFGSGMGLTRRHEKKWISVQKKSNPDPTPQMNSNPNPSKNRSQSDSFHPKLFFPIFNDIVEKRIIWSLLWNMCFNIQRWKINRWQLIFLDRFLGSGLEFFQPLDPADIPGSETLTKGKRLTVSYCMSKKTWPFLYWNSLYKNGQDFLTYSMKIPCQYIRRII